MTAIQVQFRGIVLASVLVPVPALAVDIPITAIQGADHISPLLLGGEVTTSGIVTGRFGSGFFIQSADADQDPKTSEGLYVFLPDPERFPEFEIGSTVTVTGEPVEFQPFPELPFMRTRKVVACGTIDVSEIEADDRKSFRPITELTNVSFLSVTGTAPLPEPVRLEPPGAHAPIAFADRPGTPFDPSSYPRDYFESLEGMRVLIRDAVAVSRKERSWDTFWVAAADHLDPGELTASGLPLEQHGHVFPEVIQVHKAAGQPTLAIAPGTALGDLTGILTYENGNYVVVLDTVIDPARLPQPGEAAPGPEIAPGGLRIATYNAQNLSAVSPPAKFAAIARQIVKEVGAPDILALQEIQDDDGTEVSTVVSAGQTLAALAAAIAEAGGPTYATVSLDPVLPNTDGGAPGGNIRLAFLVRSDAGITLSAPERLFDGEDRCADTNPFANARRPLLAEITVGGETYVLANLHLSSKIGDEGLYTIAEEPEAVTAEGRRRQAQALADELARRYNPATDKILLLGDFNDHAGADTLAPLRQSAFGFRFPQDARGPAHTFSHEFSGVRAAIDHIAPSKAVPAEALDLHYLNLNADALTRASDHNPVLTVIRQ